MAPSRMLRRSLLIFGAFVLLALAVTVGYALTGLSSTNTAIQEAQAALRQKRYADCLKILSHAEQSMGPTGWYSERRTLITMRAKCHLKLKNHVMARADLTRLVDDFEETDAELIGEFIRTLILTGEPEQALRRALALLEIQPDDGRIHELAGEALQRSYQEKLTAFLDQLRLWLPPPEFEEGKRAVAAYLYRQQSDPRAREGHEKIRELVKSYEPAAAVSNTYSGELKDIRELISQAQRHFRRSLELPGTPVSAYRGLAYALKQGERHDDLIALAETYLHRFDHIYAFEALKDAVQVHWDAGRYVAVAGMVDRYLPPGSWREKAARKQLSPEIGKILFLKARSLYELRDRTGLEKLLAEMEEMAKAPGLDFEVERTLTQAFVMDIDEEGWDLDTLLNPLSWDTQVKRSHRTGDDLMALLMQIRLRALDRVAYRTRNPLANFRRPLSSWIRARPNDAEPYIRRAQYLIELGKAEEALIDTQVLFRLAREQTLKNQFASDDENQAVKDLQEKALALLAEASNRWYGDSERDARALLEQCKELGAAFPREVAHPVLYISLAQLALDEGHVFVASGSSQKAVEAFQWAREPRYLRAKARMRAGEPYQAVQEMQTLLELHPDDPEGLRLLRAARKASNLSNDVLLYDVALLGEPDAELALNMVRKAVRRGDWDNARELAEYGIPRYSRNPEFSLLAASALQSIGDLENARRALAPWVEKLPKLVPSQRKTILERQVLLSIAEGEFDAEAAQLTAARRAHQHDPTALYTIARALAEKELWEAALFVLHPIFDEPQNRVKRRGVHYLLSGRLALRLGMTQLAQDQLTAALSFEDGAVASKWLALMLIRDGDAQAAADAFWDEEIVDQTGAALAARLGRLDPAWQWATERLTQNMAHAGALCIQALARTESSISTHASQLAAAEPDTLAEAVMFTREAEFLDEALDRTDKLVTAFPGNPVAAALRARVLHRADRSEEAEALLMPFVSDLTAFDELVSVLSDSDPTKLEDPSFAVRMTRLLRQHGDETPPRLRSIGLTNVARSIAEQPQTEQALDVLAQSWVQYAADTKAGTAEADILIGHGRHLDAMRLLEIAAQRYEGDELPEFFREYGKRARTCLKQTEEEEVIDLIGQQASQWIEEHGPFGELVHVQLDVMDRMKGTDRTLATLQERVDKENHLIDAHLAWFRTLRDPDTKPVVLTLRRLIRLEGREVALQRLEGLLRWDQSLLPLWVLRSQILLELGKPEVALAGMRWLFDYTNNIDVLLEYSTIAALSGRATAADEERFLREVSERASTWPRSMFVRGMLALRMGRYAEAADFLSRSNTRGNGAHIYYRALAHLSMGGEENVAIARDLFAEFDERYGLRGLSELAGHLNIQLSLPPEASEEGAESTGAASATADEVQPEPETGEDSTDEELVEETVAAEPDEGN